MVLDYKNYTLTIGGFVVLCRRKGEMEARRALVQTVETVQVPPQSVMTKVQANVGEDTGDYVIVPLESAPLLKDQPGLMLPNMLVK